jgi:hypothetical protein
MKLITVSMLRGACRSQRALFRKTFPDGAPVTMSAARKAKEAGLDVLWLTNLLPKPLDADYWAKYKPLNDDYWAKCIKLLITYLRKVPEGGRA